MKVAIFSNKDHKILEDLMNNFPRIGIEVKRTTVKYHKDLWYGYIQYIQVVSDKAIQNAPLEELYGMGNRTTPDDSKQAIQALIDRECAEAYQRGYADGWNTFNQAPYNTAELSDK